MWLNESEQELRRDLQGLASDLRWSAVETDVVRLLMVGMSQFVVKARAGFGGTVADRQGLAADLTDLLLGHAGVDFRDQRLVLVDRVGAAACQRGQYDDQRN